MRRRARAGIVTLALALTALSSCGASGTSSEDRDAGGRRRPRPAAKPGRGGVALKRIGSFQSPVYVAGAPG